MKTIRTYSAYLLLILFGCYYSGISLFSHTHIVGGVSVVHSHLGGGSDHSHSDGQYAVVDILSQFQSEDAAVCPSVCSPFYLISEVFTEYHGSIHACDVNGSSPLRGPPQG